MQNERSRKRAAEEIDIDNVVKALPSAASFAYGQWAKLTDSRLIYHRPTPNPSVVPVELRLPVFARFMENMEKPSLIVPDDMMRAIEEFFTAMCASFDNEDLQVSRARELLQRVLGVTINKAAVPAGTTDGSFLSGGAHIGFIMNLEVKNELGQGGGDPFLQNWNYQAKFWTSNRTYPVASQIGVQAQVRNFRRRKSPSYMPRTTLVPRDRQSNSAHRVDVSDQAARIEANGGREAVLRRGGFNGTPAPGEAPEFAAPALD